MIRRLLVPALLVSTATISNADHPPCDVEEPTSEQVDAVLWSDSPDDFGHGATVVFRSAHDHLRLAIATSRDLAERDAAPRGEAIRREISTLSYSDRFCEDASLTRFPRKSHVDAYERARPWTGVIFEKMFCNFQPKRALWGTFYPPADLREQLENSDPAMRAVAAEALSIHHIPEDVGLIGRLLDDDAEAAPCLAFTASASATYMLGAMPLLSQQEKQDDPIVLYRCWRRETVGECARRLLKVMTGETFADRAAFDDWWRINQGGRTCLWYWRQRLEREWAAVGEHTPAGIVDFSASRTFERSRAVVDALHGETLRTIRDELRQMPPEVEAEVYLLGFTVGGTSALTRELAPWLPTPILRVPEDRIFELLEHENWWPDAVQDEDRKEYYRLLTQRVGYWSTSLFEPEDAPRLLEILHRKEEEQMRKTGLQFVDLRIGISRLLPPAGPGMLDDGRTREGVLRQAMNRCTLSELYVYAGELLRLDAAANADFLRDLALSSRTYGEYGPASEAILPALAIAPRTSGARRLLAEVLLDPAMEGFWLPQDPDHRSYQHWGDAIRSVNTQAGRQLIRPKIKEDLGSPQTARDALGEIREALHTLVTMDGP